MSGNINPITGPVLDALGHLAGWGVSGLNSVINGMASFQKAGLSLVKPVTDPIGHTGQQVGNYFGNVVTDATNHIGHGFQSGLSPSVTENLHQLDAFTKNILPGAEHHAGVLTQLGHGAAQAAGTGIAVVAGLAAYQALKQPVKPTATKALNGVKQAITPVLKSTATKI
jgi:hypothetical protein